MALSSYDESSYSNSSYTRTRQTLRLPPKVQALIQSRQSRSLLDMVPELISVLDEIKESHSQTQKPGKN